MSKKRELGGDQFKVERRKIRKSGILDALIEYAEGKRDMPWAQASAALVLIKKVIPDHSSLALMDDPDGENNPNTSAQARKTIIETRIVDPRR
jgi:hypothetical protein